MLNVTLTPHLEFLSADKAGQKLFVMAKLRPSADVSASRPTTSFSLVIDTSGSMYDSSELGTAKIDVVIQALEHLISSSQADARDRIALVQFDDSASILLPLTPATDSDRLENAISQLRDFSGGTCMALGMEKALSLLKNSDLTSRRTLIFTDGQTFDESDCRDLAVQFAQSGIPITALGVGDYNEDLLIHLSDRTGGQLFNVIDGQSQGGTDISISDLPNTIFQQVQDVQTEVVNNLKLNLKTVQGVNLQRISRVYPDRADIPLDQQPYFIGSAQAHDDTVFLLEFDIDSRAGSRVRIAQLGLTYDIPGQQRRGELPPQNLVVQFVPGQTGMAQPNPEVMGYVQQCNIGQLVDRAATIADQNPDQAAQLLETAKRVTVKIGNDAMVQSLNLSIDEVRKTRKLSSGTRKTVKMGAKGKTVKMTSDDLNNGLSQEQIRDISGT
ncbi:MAG: Ca-activated chloride channel-like protein [Phormidium sp. OSCR]|nr:MAG: Ca-activated chloride channel-like protein [Phormidium sp. OSCR]